MRLHGLLGPGPSVISERLSFCSPERKKNSKNAKRTQRTERLLQAPPRRAQLSCTQQLLKEQSEPRKEPYSGISSHRGYYIILLLISRRLCSGVNPGADRGGAEESVPQGAERSPALLRVGLLLLTESGVSGGR